MYGNVVLGMKHHDFEHILDALKKSKGVSPKISRSTPTISKS
jgi:hypothetical protein